MALSVANVVFLGLTDRKGKLELDLTLAANDKQALAAEQADLASEYNAKLNATKVSYYHNGEYRKVDCNYLMGYGKNYLQILNGDSAIKKDNSMILSDYKGAVVMYGENANAILSVLGASAMDSNGRGKTFSKDKIPEMISYLCPGIDPEVFRDVMNGKKVSSSYTANVINQLSGEDTGNDILVDNSEKATSLVQKLIDFYLPIFSAASANGWTTEYNTQMSKNSNYISDAIASGTFCLAGVDDGGQYDPSISTEYYVINGEFSEKTDAADREAITAWYNLEKERISIRETDLDLEIKEKSAQLEALKVIMESVKGLEEAGVSMLEFNV